MVKFICKTSSAVIIFTAFYFILSAQVLAIPGYTIEIIDVPGADKTDVFGINDKGIMVGRYYSGGVHGFLYDGTTFTTIDYPGIDRFDTSIHGINNLNQFVGVYNDGNENHGFLYDGKDYSSIDYPNRRDTYARDINDSMVIAGWTRDARETGFLYSNNEFIDISPPNSSSSNAAGINNQGTIQYNRKLRNLDR